MYLDAVNNKMVYDVLIIGDLDNSIKMNLDDYAFKLNISILYVPDIIEGIFNLNIIDYQFILITFDLENYKERFNNAKILQNLKFENYISGEIYGLSLISVPTHLLTRKYFKRIIKNDYLSIIKLITDWYVLGNNHFTDKIHA